MIQHPRQYTFDPASGFRPSKSHDFQRIPEPVNIFPGDPAEKLQKIGRLSPCDLYLKLTLEAIRFSFDLDSDEFNPFRQGNGLYRQRYAETKEQEVATRESSEQFLSLNRGWKNKLKVASYLEIYRDLIRPLRRIIENTISQPEENAE